MKKIILTLIAFFSFVSPILTFKSDFVIINDLQKNEIKNDLSEIEKT